MSYALGLRPAKAKETAIPRTMRMLTTGRTSARAVAMPYRFSRIFRPQFKRHTTAVSPVANVTHAR